MYCKERYTLVRLKINTDNTNARNINKGIDSVH